MIYNKYLNYKMKRNRDNVIYLNNFFIFNSLFYYDIYQNDEIFANFDD